MRPPARCPTSTAQPTQEPDAATSTGRPPEPSGPAYARLVGIHETTRGIFLLGGAIAVAVVIGMSLPVDDGEVPEPDPTPTPTWSPAELPSLPPATVVNCGPGDNPAYMLAVRNERCMSPDPEEVEWQRFLAEMEKRLRSRSPAPFVPSPMPGGGTLCADGSWSTSSGRGTCSWHGGQARP